MQACGETSMHQKHLHHMFQQFPSTEASLQLSWLTCPMEAGIAGTCVLLCTVVEFLLQYQDADSPDCCLNKSRRVSEAMTMFNHTNWFSWVFKTLPSCNSSASRPANHHHDGTQGGAMENKASLYTGTHLLAQTDCSHCKKQPPSCYEVSNYMRLPVLPYNVLSHTAHYRL